MAFNSPDNPRMRVFNRQKFISAEAQRIFNKLLTKKRLLKERGFVNRGLNNPSTAIEETIVRRRWEVLCYTTAVVIVLVIAGKINQLIRELGLREIGKLEQDLVFGDAGTKDLINFFRTKQDVTNENKIRLLMIYAAIYPEKFDGDNREKLMQLAKLSADDMNAVHNMSCLTLPESKKTSGGFSLKFDVHKRKHATRKNRSDVEETWQLSRFYPIILELIEKLSKGDLPKNEYQCMNDPSPSFHGTSNGRSVRANDSHLAHSMRSRRTATWARPRSSDDGYCSDSVLKHASSDFKRMGQRIFIFIIGGATRSELRVAHKLTSKLKREIILGSTSLDDPAQFITKVKLLSAEEISLDDIHI